MITARIMNRLYLFYFFLTCNFFVYGQLENLDFTINQQHGVPIKINRISEGKVEIQHCVHLSMPFKLFPNANLVLSVKGLLGKTDTIVDSYYFDLNLMGDYEVTNLSSLKKCIITIAPQDIVITRSIKLDVKNDTLIYCRNKTDFDPNFIIEGNDGINCRFTKMGIMKETLHLIVNGKNVEFNNYIQTLGSLTILKLDSLKSGDKLQFNFYGDVLNPYDLCNSCLGAPENIESQLVTLKILENENLPVPVLSGSPICAGDTATLTRSSLIKNVAWGDLFSKDSSLTRKLLYPTQSFLQSTYKLPNGCYATSPDVVVTSKNCGYKMVRGYVYEDLNSNYSFDPKIDRIFPNVKVNIFNSVAFTNAKGFYEFKSDTFKLATTYYPTIVDPDYYSNYNAVSFDSKNLYAEATLRTFKLLSSDLNLQATSGRSRPGFTIPLYFNISNQGKKTNGGVLTVSLDNTYSYSSASKAPKSINGKTLTFDVDSMESGRTQTITVYAILSTTSTLGSTISSSANLSTTKPDDNIINNNFTLTSTVVGSFDPNDIEVFPKGTGPKGIIADTTKLDYTIRFQNLGTDTAFTVVVKNKLPNGVDFNQFKMVGASHNYQLSMQGTDTIVWTFNKILLPDNKKNEPKSHGFIRYKINQKSKNASGTEIRNEAKVYFDFNAAIATNQVLNTVNPITTGFEFADALSGFQLYPNPTEGILNIVSPIAGKLVLSNILGQSVYQSQIEKEEKLDISGLEKGLYVFTFETLEGKKSGKLIIK